MADVPSQGRSQELADLRAGHDPQGIPAATRHPQHGGSGQAHQREPMPDTRRRPGVEPRTARPERGRGLPNRRRITPRYRALVLLATFGNLRGGELTGLRRRNLDLDAGTVRVDETVYELGPLVKGTPKSEASRRTVALPDLIIPTCANTWTSTPNPAPRGSCSSAFRAGRSGGAISPRPGHGRWRARDWRSARSTSMTSATRATPMRPSRGRRWPS